MNDGALKKSFCLSRILLPGVGGVISFLFLLLNSFTTSPLFLNDGMDSAVFKTVGFAWLEGRIPYRDIFDHKGPLLYLFNAAGQGFIPGRMGIFLLQWLSLFITGVFSWKFIGLVARGWRRVLSLALTLVLAAAFISEGNQCEEWMLPFVSFCLYVLLRCSLSEEYPKRWETIAIGGCFAAVFLIRPNDAVLFVGGMVAGWTCWLGMHRLMKGWWAFLCQCVVGALLVTLPFVIGFALKGALDDLWYGLIAFNFRYAGGASGRGGSLLLKFVALLPFFCLPLLSHRARRPAWAWLFALVPIGGLFLMGNEMFLHYLISFLPLYAVFFALLLTSRSWVVALFASCVFVFSIVGIRKDGQYSPRIAEACWTQPRDKFSSVFWGKQERIRRFYQETDRLVALVPAAQRNEIWNYNLCWEGGSCLERSYFSLFWHAGILPLNYITYYRELREDPSLLERNNLSASKPAWVLLTHASDAEGFYEQSDYDFLERAYDRVDCADPSVCDLELWRRKDGEPPIIIEDIQ